MSNIHAKKSDAIIYHRIHEVVVPEIMKICTEQNYADLCTKALNGFKIIGLSKGILFEIKWFWNFINLIFPWKALQD